MQTKYYKPAIKLQALSIGNRVQFHSTEQINTDADSDTDPGTGYSTG